MVCLSGSYQHISICYLAQRPIKDTLRDGMFGDQFPSEKQMRQQ